MSFVACGVTAAQQTKLSNDKAAGIGFTEVTGWRTSGDSKSVLFDASGGAWNNGNGRFTAMTAGNYSVSANIRGDSHDSTWHQGQP